MEMPMLEKVIEYVDGLFANDKNFEMIKEHFERTVFWVKELNPNADEAMLIAAYSHDVQRAFKELSFVEMFKDKELNDPEILEHHQSEGARIMWVFLFGQGYGELSAQRVYDMISRHEDGGSEESNLIKDADSISYFETIAIAHIAHAKELGKEKIKRKLEYMHHRITSGEAKKAAFNKYQEVMRILNKS